MRRLFVTLAAVVLGFLCSDTARADKVEVKGVHLCCAQCVTNVANTLKKVEGVTDAKCDRAAKTVSFTAKDDKVATAAVKALADAGFYGAATDDGKEIKIELASPKKGEKADAVTVEHIHVCCGQCKRMIEGIFKDTKVEVTGTGPIKTVTITGKELDKAEVLEALRKAGFNGTVK